MNQRELSERLEGLANLLESDHGIEGTIETVVAELRKLSNQEYAPGNNLSWQAIQPKTKSGKKLPF